jgi:hypothetical protein
LAQEKPLNKKPAPSTRRGPKTQEDISKAIEACLQRFTQKKERDYFRSLLTDLIRNNIIPLSLLNTFPVLAVQAGKTRFDQVYDAVMAIAFPGYRIETLQRMLGPAAEIRKDTKIWRAVFPERFGLSHVFLRADDYQHAFALACDYACRVSLQMFRHIPADLTIRVMFVSEKAIRRKLDMRWANRVQKRKLLQLVGRKYSSQEIAGARTAGLGKHSNPQYQIIRYIERKDRDYLMKQNIIKTSEVESEVFRPRLKLS